MPSRTNGDIIKDGLHSRGLYVKDFKGHYEDVWDWWRKEAAEKDRLKEEANADNNEKFISRQGSSWGAMCLTPAEAAYVYARDVGRCRGRLDRHKQKIPCPMGYGKTRWEPMPASKATIDHAFPQSQHAQGVWRLENWCLRCMSCNSSKGDRYPSVAHNVGTAMAPGSPRGSGDGSGNAGSGSGSYYNSDEEGTGSGNYTDDELTGAFGRLHT